MEDEARKYKEAWDKCRENRRILMRELDEARNRIAELEARERYEDECVLSMLDSTPENKRILVVCMSDIRPGVEFDDVKILDVKNRKAVERARRVELTDGRHTRVLKDAHAPVPEIKGCELCGDFPVGLHGRCHTTAPLRIDMEDSTTMVVRCFLPECNRVVAKFRVELLPRDGE